MRKLSRSNEEKMKFRMSGKIEVEPHVDAIKMPGNLKVGLMIAQHRKQCQNMGCHSQYYGFAFGQSPFHVPLALQHALADNTDKGHYSSAEGISQLRDAISGFNKRHFGLDVA
jgi:aspartate aminotransferase